MCPETAGYGNMKIRLHNTLTGKVQPLSPSTPGEVRLYSCGPTVYNYAHVGNLRTYVFSDVLRRTLRSAGFRVRHVMNVTDVGHLQSDADEGEDKMAPPRRRTSSGNWATITWRRTSFVGFSGESPGCHRA